MSARTLRAVRPICKRLLLGPKFHVNTNKAFTTILFLRNGDGNGITRRSSLDSTRFMHGNKWLYTTEVSPKVDVNAVATADPLSIFNPPTEQITTGASPSVDTNSSSVKEEFDFAIVEMNRGLSRLTKWGNFVDIYNHCQAMKNRGIKPNTKTYNLLLQVYHREGLFHECIQLLHEMIKHGIPPDLETFDFVLLSTSYELTGIYREYIWSLLEKHDLRPSSLTYEHYLESFLVLEEFEHAVDVLDEIIENKIVPTARTFWQVTKLAISLNEADSAFETLLKFEKQYPVVLPTIYMETLRCASAHFHLEGIIHCWKKIVDDAKMVPDQGVCLNIINAAARFGKPDLATAVIKLLVANRIKIEEQHFAALLASYVGVGDLKRAFNVLELARASGAEPDYVTAMPITDLIKSDVEKIDDAYYTLEELHSKGRKVDVSALNAIIRACRFAVYNEETGSREADIHRAVETYNQAEKLNITPNAQTFEMLMECCLSIKHRLLGQQFMEEMRNRGIGTSPEVYTNMIQLLCTDTDYEDAFTLLEEMKSHDILPPRTAYEAIVRKCALHRDPRANIALEEMQTVGYETPQALVNFVRTGIIPNTNVLNYMRKEPAVFEGRSRKPNISVNPELDMLQAALDNLGGDNSDFNIPNLNQQDNYNSNY
ncbi:6585_t:CDS:2 [Ambispora gerdemannii]|uniref:6585_t:CDS:1 n=1 Tax=Ambispora gerdemannii TaxID=144530 RepID=A0A9N9AAD9_9GLOM|nr:6585_t:CDS:2 [Ambispora gerdemannii]